MLEIREMHPLEMGEEIVAHGVLGLAGGVEHHVARAGAEGGLSGGEDDNEKGKAQDVIESGARFLQRVDDLADEARGDDGCERAPCGEANAHQELQSVAGEVMEEGRACGGHSVTSLAFPRLISRVDFPPIQTIATITAKPTKTGATPPRPPTGPPRTTGTSLKMEQGTSGNRRTHPRTGPHGSPERRALTGP